MSRVFALPDLARINGQASPLASSTYGVLEPFHLELILEMFGPLFRALELSGWACRRLVLGTAPEAPASWLLVDMSTNVGTVTVPAVTSEADGVESDDSDDVIDTSGDLTVVWDGAGGTGAVALVDVRPRVSPVDGTSLAIPLPDQLDFVNYGDLTRVLLVAQDPIVEARDAFGAFDAAIVEGVASLRNALDTAWTGTGDDRQPGLLWLFDPDQWVESPEDFPDLATVREVITDATSRGRADPDFIDDQIFGRGNLVKLLRSDSDEGEPQRRSDAVNAADFLRAALDRLTIDAVVGGMPIDVSESLRDLPLLDVLMHIVESGLVTVGHLPVGPGISGFTLADSTPIVATRVVRGDDDAVEIRIGESAALYLVIERAVAGEVLGRPPDEVTWEEGSRFFAWEHVPGPDGDTLLVVAGPPIAIQNYQEFRRDVRLEVFRVPDVALVPQWGTRIEPSLYTATFTIGRRFVTDARGDTDADQVPVPNAFTVRLRRDGFNLTYPAVDEDGSVPPPLYELTVRATHLYNPSPMWALSVSEFTDPNTSTSGSRIRHNVQVRIAGNVEVTEKIDADMLAVIERGIKAPVTWATLPRWGAKIDPNDGLDTGGVDQNVDWSTYAAIITTFVDVGIGFIPVVGDVADGWELVSSFVTGQDRWRRPVTYVDRTFMALGLLPVVSGPLLRGMAGLPVVTAP
jgi:hypothetical protein